MCAKLRDEIKTNSNKMKRIASLDFLRGFAIWMMVFLHVFNHKYNYDWVFEVGIENVFQYTNPFFGAFIYFSGFFGNWVGIFILVSGVVNTISFVKRVSRGDKASRVFLKQILTGIGILIAGFFAESFGYYGYFGTVIKTGELFKASSWINAAGKIWTQIWRMEALQIIGWSMILTAIFLFFITKNEGYKRILRNLIITISVVVLLSIATPFVWQVSANINWIVPPGVEGYHATWPSSTLQFHNAGIGTYFMMVISGDYYALFPFLITSFVGVGFGLALSMEKPPKRLPFWGLISFIILGVIGGLSTLIMDFDITFDRPTYPFYFMLLACQVGVMTLLLWLVEYRGKSQKFGNNNVVKYFRVWGTISLSIFVLQIWHLLPYAIMNPFFPNVDVLGGQFSQGGEYWVLLLAFITILFFDLLIWLWAQVNFFLSFEWMIINFSRIASKEKSQRLNFKTILNDIDWLNYKNLSEK